MTTPQRTPLTAEQELIAERLKLAWMREKGPLGLNQTQAALVLGITQGSLTQYLNKHIAANTDFVLKFCRLLKTDPAEIHPSFNGILLSEQHHVPVLYRWGSRSRVRPEKFIDGLIVPFSGIFAVRGFAKNVTLLCHEPPDDRRSLGWIDLQDWTLQWRTPALSAPSTPFWSVQGILGL